VFVLLVEKGDAGENDSFDVVRGFLNDEGDETACGSYIEKESVSAAGEGRDAERLYL